METGGACWDNWIEAIRRKEGNPEIRWEVDDGKTGEEGLAKTRRWREQADVSEETGNTLRKGRMAAMATIGVVKQGGQLSHGRERPSMCEVTWALTNAAILKKWRFVSPFRGRHRPGFRKKIVFDVS